MKGKISLAAVLIFLFACLPIRAAVVFPPQGGGGGGGGSVTGSVVVTQPLILQGGTNIQLPANIAILNTNLALTNVVGPLVNNSGTVSLPIELASQATNPAAIGIIPVIPRLGNVVQDVGSSWWSGFSPTRETVIQTNEYPLVNPFNDGIAFARRSLTFTPPAGVTSVVAFVNVKGMAAADTAIRMDVYAEPAFTSIANTNATISDAGFSSVTLTSPVTNGVTYRWIMWVDFGGSPAQSSYFVKDLELRWNGVATTNWGFDVTPELLHGNYGQETPANVAGQTWPGTELQFQTLESTVTFDTYSDLTNTAETTVRSITVLTNGTFNSVVIVTNVTGSYTTANLGSGLKTVTLINGSQVIYSGNRQGTWVRRVYTTNGAPVNVLRPSVATDIFIVGDSMSCAVYLTNFSQSWPKLLSKMSGKSVTIRAAGYWGIDFETNSNFIELRNHIRAASPSTIILADYYNPHTLNRMTNSDIFRVSSNRLVALTRDNPQAQIIVIPPVGYRTTSNSFGETIAQTKTVVTNSTLGFPRVFLLGPNDLVKTNEFSDGVHPDATGNSRWASVVREALRDYTLGNSDIPVVVGGSGGTNFPPVISSFTNVAVGSGVRQSIAFAPTSSNQFFNVQGTPVNGEDIIGRWTNSASTNVLITFRVNGSAAAFRNYLVGSNDTSFAVPAGDMVKARFTWSTNYGSIWEMSDLDGPQLEIGPGPNLAWTANGLLLTPIASVSVGTNTTFLTGITGTVYRSGVVASNEGNNIVGLHISATSSGGGSSSNREQIISLTMGASTNIVIDLASTSSNKVVYLVAMLTNGTVSFSNAAQRANSAEVIFQQDTNGNRVVNLVRSTEGLVRVATNSAPLVLTTNASATDKWVVSSDYFSTNITVSAGISAAGVEGSVQYNGGSAFKGVANFVYDAVSEDLYIIDTIGTTPSLVVGTASGVTNFVMPSGFAYSANTGGQGPSFENRQPGVISTAIRQDTNSWTPEVDYQLNLGRTNKYWKDGFIANLYTTNATFPGAGIDPTATQPLTNTLFFDRTQDSLAFYGRSTNTLLNIGQETWVRVVNQTGSTISNGWAVYVVGSTNTWPTVAPAQANFSISSRVLGLATEQISNGSTGMVTIAGVVNGVDTSLYTNGTKLWLSAYTPGFWTNRAPSGTNFNYFVGYLTHSNSTAGRVAVQPTPAIDERDTIYDATFTGAGPTALATWGMTNNSVASIEYRLTVSTTTGSTNASAVYTRIASIACTNSTCRIIGTTATPATLEDSSAWNSDVTVSGATFSVNHTGTAGTGYRARLRVRPIDVVGQ